MKGSELDRKAAEIGGRIAYVRKLNELTQRELGERLGYGRGAVSKYESGMNEVPVDFVNDFCAEFKVSHAWVMAGAGAMQAESGAGGLDALVASLPAEVQSAVKLVVQELSAKTSSV